MILLDTAFLWYLKEIEWANTQEIPAQRMEFTILDINTEVFLHLQNHPWGKSHAGMKYSLPIKMTFSEIIFLDSLVLSISLLISIWILLKNQNFCFFFMYTL